jgi:hypothetical protein
MERFNALGRGAQLMLIGGVLLFIDLFLPWQDFGNEFSDAVGVDASFNGWRGIGFVLGLLTIVLLAWLVVRLASVNIPLPVSTAMTGALLGVLILVFAIIKLLTILGDEATIWAWIGVALAVVIAVGAFQVVQEAGGVDQLRDEASTLGGATGGAAASAAAPESAGAAAAPGPAPDPPAAPVIEATPAATESAATADDVAGSDAADAADETENRT